MDKDMSLSDFLLHLATLVDVNALAITDTACKRGGRFGPKAATYFRRAAELCIDSVEPMEGEAVH